MIQPVYTPQQLLEMIQKKLKEEREAKNAKCNIAPRTTNS